MAKARKEIDKDSMYQKIMPSAMRSAQPDDDSTPAAPAKKPSTRSTPRKAPAKKAAPAPVEEAYEDLPEDEPAPVVAPRRAIAPAPTQRKPAAPPAEAKSDIVNVMELLIDQKISLAMEKFHCCTCDRCRQDITAMALNKLHPKYIVAEPDQLAIGMEDKESNTQVTTALVQAILKVKANPKH